MGASEITDLTTMLIAMYDLKLSWEKQKQKIFSEVFLISQFFFLDLDCGKTELMINAHGISKWVIEKSVMKHKP